MEEEQFSDGVSQTVREFEKGGKKVGVGGQRLETKANLLRGAENFESAWVDWRRVGKGPAYI